MAIEFVWLKKIDFFPSQSRLTEKLARKDAICIGTKSRSLGDALVLTGLPAKLQKKYPGIQVYTYPRAFNPVAFRGNPHVRGLSYLPDELFGDDANWGHGHLIHLKEQFFDLPLSLTPRPELHLLSSEKTWVDGFLQKHLFPGNHEKPLCVIHPWGSTRHSVAAVEFWDELVARWSHRFRFWQVGVEGHGAVQGCEYYLLLPRAFHHSRKLFSLLSRANLFIGVDSGPMHAARAFNVPSLIFLDHADPQKVFEDRAKWAYYLRNNWRHSVLYEENTHLNPRLEEPRALQSRIDAFFESAKPNNSI